MFGMRSLPGALAVAMATACSTIAEDDETPEIPTAATSSGDEDGGGDDTTGGAPLDPGTEAGTDGEGTGADTTSGEPPAPSAGFDPCPDPLPAPWVLCEDFEQDVDLARAYFEYQSGDGAFVRTEGDAASGDFAMRTHYAAGVEGAGWLSAAIGRNPAIDDGTANVAPSDDFTEIYWRVRVKTQAGWPGLGFGHLSSASVFASEAWTQAMVARLRSADEGAVLLGDAITCVEGGAIECAGYDDASSQERIHGLLGVTPIFAEAAADTWHCVEAHVALNTQGKADGVFEFWVDGTLESSAYELDWRGTWGEFGINVVTLENVWPGGAPQDLERSIDDFVISRAPIGC
jgi:hypothetical protein